MVAVIHSEAEALYSRPHYLYDPGRLALGKIAPDSVPMLRQGLALHVSMACSVSHLLLLSANNLGGSGDLGILVATYLETDENTSLVTAPWIATKMLNVV